MSLVATMPGKIGDALLEYPVIWQLARQRKERFELWLDEKTLKPLVSLFECQPSVSQVKLLPGIKHYGCGGQPWDFGLKTEDHGENEVYHLGMRKFPQEQITLETASNLPAEVSREALVKECALEVPDAIAPSNRLVLHGTFTTHTTGTPTFWRFLSLHWEELRGMFDEIYFTGSPAERERALEVYPDARAWEDDGEILKVARLMVGSRAVIGSGSSGCALAAVLKVPCLRVHDPIGNAPKVIWSGLGPNQMNETEPDLHAWAWQRFKDEILEASRAEVVG